MHVHGAQLCVPCFGMVMMMFLRFLVMILLSRLSSESDMNILTGKAADFIGIQRVTDVIVRISCDGSTTNCRLTMLDFTPGVGGEEQLSLVKRFEIDYVNESCGYYISDTERLFAAFRFCREGLGTQSRVRKVDGTFVKSFTRYDIAFNGTGSYRLMASTWEQPGRFHAVAVNKAPDYGRQSVSVDPDLMSQYKPETRLMGEATVELLIGIDESVEDFFDRDVDAIVNSVTMASLVADSAMKSDHMNMNVKLIGIRFWSKFGFKRHPVLTNSSFAHYGKALSQFIMQHMIDLRPESAGVSSEMIRGKPDAIITLTQVDPGINPPAVLFKSLLSDHALVKFVHGNNLSMSSEKPGSRLHHYKTGIWIANMIGQMMGLRESHTYMSENKTATLDYHLEEDMRECIQSYGDCVMSDSDDWRLPTFNTHHRRVSWKTAVLGGRNEHLILQNVDFYTHDNVTGPSLHPRIISTGMGKTTRAVMYVLLVISILFPITITIIWMTYNTDVVQVIIMRRRRSSSPKRRRTSE